MNPSRKPKRRERSAEPKEGTWKKQLTVPRRQGDALRIIPLGGQEEVGRNMTVFEYGRDIVILDMGIQFPEEDMPGIDYIIPNVSYLKGKERDIRGVIFSHGHLDHIGASSILLEKLGNPLIIGRPLTLALVKHRVEDHQKGAAKRLKTVVIQSVNQKIRLGAFTVSFFPVDHSIMDAIGVALTTPEGTVIHPGDWTYEKQPVGRHRVEYHTLARFLKPTVLMLESLGATTYKERVPERVMIANLHKLIREAPGRLIIGTFASQVARIKHVLEYAEQIGKKVALDGYSMKMNVRIASELGYIKVKQGTLITIEETHKYPDGKVVIICTGAQGEGNAVLSRIVNGSHRFIHISPTDTIVFSSSVIPGNERTIQRLKDNLYRLTDFVVHSDIMDVHSSGHSTAEDLLAVLRQIRPTFFLPVYANHYFLKEAKKLAEGVGFPKDRIAVLDNGSVFELRGGRWSVAPKKVPTDYVFVDGLGIGDVSHLVLRDRQQMAADGMLVVIVGIDAKSGRLVGTPDIISRGFVHMKESKDLIAETQQRIKKTLSSHVARVQIDDMVIKNKIRDDLGNFLFQRTERRPMILPVLIEV